MRDRILPDLFPRRTLVDADHGDPDRPGGVADTKPEVGVVGGLIFALLHVVHDFGEVFQDVVFEGLRGARRDE